MILIKLLISAVIWFSIVIAVAIGTYIGLKVYIESEEKDEISE